MESIFSRSSCVKGPFFFQIGTCSHHITAATPQQTCDKTSSSLVRHGDAGEARSTVPTRHPSRVREWLYLLPGP